MTAHLYTGFWGAIALLYYLELRRIRKSLERD